MKIIVLIFIALLVNVAISDDIPRKKLAGPPSEFEIHELPDPSVGTLTSQSLFLGVDLVNTANEQSGESFTWKSEIPVDSEEMFIFSFTSPLEKHLTLSLLDPNGKKIDLESIAIGGGFPLGEYSMPATNYPIHSPQPGMYTLIISGSYAEVYATQLESLASSDPDAYVIWFNFADIYLQSQLVSYDLHAGSAIGLVASVYDSQPNASMIGRPLSGDLIGSATMSVTYPNGQEAVEVMTDDGLKGDGEPDDGIYGADVSAHKTGNYILQSVFTGKTADGTPFIRSTSHLVPVITDTAEYAGTAVGVFDEASQRIMVNLHVDSAPSLKYKAYSEVWGIKDGKEVPICWIGGIVDVLPDADGRSFIQMEIDLNWLKLAGASQPLTLKEARLQDIDSSIPISFVELIEVEMTTDLNELLLATEMPTEITEMMLFGARPVFAQDNGLQGQLILLHGYCSDRNPWQLSASDFTAAHYFTNPGASIGHDEFAQKVAAFAKSQNIASYSLIGHSQGGPVSVTLNNFYWSGLDVTDQASGRLIQSVGSPYQGCSAAGSAAGIGKLFGVGCGANKDLTIDGSNLWLAGISTAIRKNVWFYTTTYVRNQFFGDYCNLAINAILNFPNDGTTEMDRANLPMANGMGNTEKYCHVEGMKYPAQYLDHNRNIDMNLKAAR